jgi:hypothetical protein
MPGRVLHCSRLIKQAAESRMARIIQSPIYPKMTIRRWNTTTSRLALMRQAD